MTSVLLPKHRPIANLSRNPASAWRHLDLVLVGCVGVVGMVMIYSATRGPIAPYDTSYLKKQFMYFVLGGLAMAGATLVDYRRIRDYAPFIYAGSLVLLLGVKVVGRSVNGTQGWYQLGPFQLQPSEPAKLGLILGFAWLAAQFDREIDNRRFVSLLVVAGIPMALVMLQPDLGTTLVSAAIMVTLLVVVGARPRQLGVIGVIAVLGVVVVLHSGMLGRYQQDRLSGFLDQPKSSTVDLATVQNKAIYTLAESKTAIGSGGLFGKGLFRGPETRLGHVPEQQTDFIFTAVGEQVGLVGSALLLALFAVLVWRVWRTAQLARDDFGMLICAGVLAMLVFQVFENVGMTMGIMPITGIPLPFMSYGGSSTVTYLVMMGLVLNVHMRRFS
jgi:rod shape determining protein RodA